MRLRTYFLVSATLLGCCNSLWAQQKWNLRQCVDYAMQHNLNIKQVALQEKFSELSLKQSNQALLPNVSFSTGTSLSSGRRQDPTSFSLITQSSIQGSMQLQSSVDIFNWFRKKNTIAANEWELQASRANTDKVKNDIALLIANYYLQILLAQEQAYISGVQLEQSKSQLGNTRKLVNAGSLPELNAAELEAQVARDSANFIAAKGAVNQALLTLKASMNLDAAAPFEIEAPAAEKIPVENIADLQPEVVYALAVANLPQQRYNALKIKAAEKNKEVAKAGMYPSISGFGGLNTSFLSKASEVTGYTILPITPYIIGKVNVGGTNYNVFTPDGLNSQIPNVSKTPFFTQLSNNFSQSLGISLNIPILSGGALRNNYQRAKLTITNLELQQEVDNQKIKQDIYLAYNNALVALERFNASKKTVETAERSYSFAQKRYNVGMLTTLELVTNQNNLYREKLQYVLNQFDYVFKMKVLEFYKGQGIKL